MQHAEALRRHFNKIILKYGPQVKPPSQLNYFHPAHSIAKSIVNLAELNGREGVLSQAYNQHITEWNSPDVEYGATILLR